MRRPFVIAFVATVVVVATLFFVFSPSDGGSSDSGGSESASALSTPRTCEPGARDDFIVIVNAGQIDCEEALAVLESDVPPAGWDCGGFPVDEQGRDYDHASGRSCARGSTKVSAIGEGSRPLPKQFQDALPPAPPGLGE